MILKGNNGRRLNLLNMFCGSGISSQSLVEAKGWLQKMNEKHLEQILHAYI